MYLNRVPLQPRLLSHELNSWWRPRACVYSNLQNANCIYVLNKNVQILPLCTLLAKQTSGHITEHASVGISLCNCACQFSPCISHIFLYFRGEKKKLLICISHQIPPKQSVAHLRISPLGDQSHSPVPPRVAFDLRPLWSQEYVAPWLALAKAGLPGVCCSCLRRDTGFLISTMLLTYRTMLIS